MDFFQRLIHDFDRLPYHYNIVTLYSLFFQRALPIISLIIILLGLLVTGYALPDAPGQPRRTLRRVALAALLSAFGIVLYTVVPIWLDSAGLTPVPGHLRFYGMFFLPVGALAGVLAALMGSRRAVSEPKAKPRRLQLALNGYLIGFVVMWLVFLLYSRIILGTTMVVSFGLIRATVTAGLGALLFAFAPYLVRAADRGSGQRLLPWGYGLVVAGCMLLTLAQVVTQILSFNADIL